MQGVRLEVGIAGVMPPAPPRAPEPPPEPPEGAFPESVLAPKAASNVPPPPPRPERTGWRGGVARALRKPAEYARAYLTASLDHQFALQAARTAEIAARTARLEETSPLIADLLAEVRGVALRLDGVEHNQHQLARALTELHKRQQALPHDLLGAVSPRFDRVEQGFAALAPDLLGAVSPRFDRVEQALGAFGPRLDELDVKVRPLVEVDAESVAVRTGEGYVFLPRSEVLFTLMVANAGSGGLEPGTRRVLQALARPGGGAADVGANVGLLTTALAAAVGATGRVWAFEPEARVRAQLARTLHLNGLAQVTLSGAAVGREAGRLTFHESPVIGHSSLYALPDDEQAQARTVEVEVVRLDDVVPAGARLDVVKIDVEGAELDVLAGMSRVLADNPDLAVVAEFGPSHLARVGIAPTDWFAAFAAHGLEPRLIGEPDGRTSPTDAEALARVESANLVFVRPGGEADGRLPR